MAVLQGHWALLLWCGLVAALPGLLLAWRGVKRAQPDASWAADLVFPVVVIVGLTLPMSRGLLHALRGLLQLIRESSAVNLALQFAYGALLVWLIGSVARGRLWARVSSGRFVLGCFGIGLILRAAYVYWVDTPPVSDFAHMWKLAGQAMGGSLLESPDLFTERVWPYFVPLSVLFGRSTDVYEYANVAVHLGSCYLLFILSRRWFGESVGRASMLMALVAPETLFNSVIPTHDIPGVFYLLVSLLLLDAIVSASERQRWRTAMCTGLLLGVTLVVLDLQRQVRLFWLAGVCACLVPRLLQDLLSARRRKACSKTANPGPGLVATFVIVVAALALPLVVSHVVMKRLQAVGVMRTPAERRAFESEWLAANTDSWGDGTYAHAKRNYYDPYDPFLDGAEWHALARRKFISDTTRNPVNRIRNYLKKSAVLYDLGSQSYFYFEAGSNGRVAEAQQRLSEHNLVFVALFEGAFVIASLALLLQRRIPTRAWPGVLILGCLSGALLLLGEAQPRYMYPIWFLGPPLICAFVSCPAVEQSRRAPGEFRSALVPLASAWGLLVALGVLSSFAGIHALAAKPDRLFLDFSRWTDFGADTGESDCAYLAKLQPSVHAQRQFRIVLGHHSLARNDSRVSVSHSFSVPDARPRSFRVYVYAAGEKGRPLPIRSVASAAAEGGRADTAVICEAAAPQRLELKQIQPVAGRITLELAVTAAGAVSTPQEGPHFNFEFGELFAEPDDP